MSPTTFGVSFNVVSTAIQLNAATYAALGHFSRTNATINGLWNTVPALGEAFGRFEETDFDLLEPKDREKLGKITKASIESLNAILPVLTAIRSRKRGAATKGLVVPTQFASMIAEARQAITSSIAPLKALLSKVESRRNAVISRLPHLLKSPGIPATRTRLSSSQRGSTISQTPQVSSDAASSRSLEFLAYEYRRCRREAFFTPLGLHLSSSRGRNIRSRLDLNFSWPRSCIRIMAFFANFVGLSCFLGVFFTVNKSYGYSMGDAFTLAGWVLAVGAFMSSAILAYHHPRCKCWEPSNYRQLSRHGDYDLQTFAELPG